MENVLPSMSWDSKKWISFINRSFLDVYGVKLAALSRSHSDRDEFRLQTTVVTPFHLNKELQAKYRIERDVALMTSDGDFFGFGSCFITAMDTVVKTDKKETKKEEIVRIKSSRYDR